MRELILKREELTVGKVRQQGALSDSQRRVVLVAEDKTDAELVSILRRLSIVSCYPDTTDENGGFEPDANGQRGSFKIVIARK